MIYETNPPIPSTVAMTMKKFDSVNSKGNGIVAEAITSPKLICNKPKIEAINKPVPIAIEVMIKPV